MRKKARLPPWGYKIPPFDDMVPKLTSAQRSLISQHFERRGKEQKIETIPLDDEDWRMLDALRNRYAVLRANEHLSATLPQMLSLARPLYEVCSRLSELTQRSEMFAFDFWERLNSALPAYSQIQIREFAEGVMAFTKQTFAADESQENAKRKFEEQIAQWESLDDSWMYLIRTLARHFELKGLKPTASKSLKEKGGRGTLREATPSAFVALVAEVMWTVPKWSQHMHGLIQKGPPDEQWMGQVPSDYTLVKAANPSWAALSFAVSEALAKLRSEFRLGG
jgi:hypothetical protein